jgi:hypothetical protein
VIIWSTVSYSCGELGNRPRGAGAESSRWKKKRGGEEHSWAIYKCEMEDGVVLLEEPGQWHEQRGGTADKDVSDRKKAADGCGIVREKKLPSRR